MFKIFWIIPMFVRPPNLEMLAPFFLSLYRRVSSRPDIEFSTLKSFTAVCDRISRVGSCYIYFKPRPEISLMHT